MSMFSGMRDAKASDGYTRLGAGGIFELEVDRIYLKNTINAGDAVIAEFIVKASSLPSNPPGSEASWYQGLGKKLIAFGAIKSLLIPLMGFQSWDKDREASELTPVIEDLGDWMLSPANPLKGLMVLCKTRMGKTKEKQQDFLYHDWETIDYAARGLPVPDFRGLLARIPRTGRQQYANPGGPPPGYPPQGVPYQAPPPAYGPPPYAPPQAYQNGPPVYGAPTTAYSPPPYAPPPVAAPQLSPDGFYMLVNGAWVPRK